MRNFNIKIVNRIIDANINRAKEGLRVCEEITRFILNDRGSTGALKTIRHGIDGVARALCRYPAELTESRQSGKDVGRDIYANELKRNNINDIFCANIQRVKESVRVLEEFAKLSDVSLAKKIKKTRYSLYEIEKNALKKIRSLRDCG
ncbi:MAG: thiamine-phosphate pyrophosphorylase [Candidatus Omnitrophica bacterium]|nr:thiamine-phosphate pyrophosphorylase [Candidatus Omnitrophota bacterium]